MYRKVIKTKEDLHLPLTISYLQFNSLSKEDQRKYILDDRIHFQDNHLTEHSLDKPSTKVEKK